jgi:hypothetical protein
MCVYDSTAGNCARYSTAQPQLIQLTLHQYYTCMQGKHSAGHEFNLLAVGGFVVMMTREALPIAADSTTLSRSGPLL